MHVIAFQAAFISEGIQPEGDLVWGQKTASTKSRHQQRHGMNKHRA
jgi:hypothetical protein